FLVNVPIGLALIPLCLRYVPADGPRHAQPGRHLDVPGIGLLGAGLLAAMIGLAYLGDTPSGWMASCIAALVVSVLALGAFAWHTEHAADPLIPPRLIRGRGFGAVNLICVVYSGFGAGLVALIPLYATNRYGFGPFDSGTLLAAQAVGAVILSTVDAFALRRTGYRLPLYSAAVLVAIGMLVLAFAPVHIPTYVWLALGAALVGVGIGWSSPASRNAGLQLVPDQAASIAVLRSTAIQIGSITAISITTAIIAHAADPGTAQAWVYGAYAGLLLLVGLPASSRILEHKGAW
ncbi:MAG TPA: MFS transporter, partial [Rhodanobacteraceae bacterium]